MSNDSKMSGKYWFRCPNGHLGLIDDEQLSGDVSIICDSCDFHGYVNEGETEP